MTLIPFTNLKSQQTPIRKQLFKSIKNVIDSGCFILGKQLQNFEKNFASYNNCKYCAGVASGTDAITLSLWSLGICSGDEVITSNITAYPTITGISNSGAKPVVVDIDEETGLIDCSLIESKITNKTRAIVAVHLYGQCCDMEMLSAICKKHNLFLIEDAAQATGATYNNQKAGTFGDCGSFSFYPTKNLGALGDGGAVVTNSKDTYEKIIQLRNYGQKTRYSHETHGINSRLDEIQAAILDVKLPYLDEWNHRRNVIAAYYREHLKTVTCLKKMDKNTTHNYHLFIVKHPKRDSLMNYLNQNGIQVLIHYPVPVHLQKAFNFQKDESFVKSVNFANSIVSLPIYPELSDNDVEKIVSTVNSFES